MSKKYILIALVGEGEEKSMLNMPISLSMTKFYFPEKELNQNFSFILDRGRTFISLQTDLDFLTH